MTESRHYGRDSMHLVSNAGVDASHRSQLTAVIGHWLWVIEILY